MGRTFWECTEERKEAEEMGCRGQQRQRGGCRAAVIHEGAGVGYKARLSAAPPKFSSTVGLLPFLHRAPEDTSEVCEGNDSAERESHRTSN